VISLVFVGTIIFTVLLVICNSVPFFWIASIILTSAPALIPDNLFFSAVVKSSVLSPLPVTLSTLLSKAVFIILFCTGLVELEERVLSTVVLFAPAAIPESLVFSSLV